MAWIHLCLCGVGLPATPHNPFPFLGLSYREGNRERNFWVERLHGLSAGWLGAKMVEASGVILLWIIPQTVLALRGSHGVDLVPGISSSQSSGAAAELPGSECPLRATAIISLKKSQFL